MDVENDDYEEQPAPSRGGIGSARAGLGSGRTGTGIGFAPAGTLRDDPMEESLPSMGRGGIGSTSRMGGIGAKKVPTFASAKAPVSENEMNDGDDEPSSSRTGLGSKGPSQSRDPPISSAASPLPPPSSNSGTSTPQQAGVPTAFGSRPQRSFLRNSQPATPGLTPVQLSYEEKQHFAKISGGFGARMMAKMGWEAVSVSFLSFLKASLLTLYRALV